MEESNGLYYIYIYLYLHTYIFKVCVNDNLQFILLPFRKAGIYFFFTQSLINSRVDCIL